MSRRPKLIVLGLAVAVLVAGTATWSRWLFLWDGFGHRGIYLCARGVIDGADTIQCNGDVDELVYERVFLPAGGQRESWVCGGALEFRRVLSLPGAKPVDLRRDFGDRWSVLVEGEPPPFGRTTCTCHQP
jgi:hypothetical protein